MQMGLYDPAEADLEHSWNCSNAGFLGARLYTIQCLFQELTLAQL